MEQCVICLEATTCSKSCVECNICHGIVCKVCLQMMKENKKSYLRKCPLCRGKNSLRYGNNRVALLYDKKEFEDNYTAAPVSVVHYHEDRRHFHLIVTLPRIIFSWMFFIMWTYYLLCLLFQDSVNFPLFFLCFACMAHFYSVL